VGNLLGEKIHGGVQNIWGRSHLGFFMDAVKKKYYPMGNYYDQYMRWTTLDEERGKIMSEFTNTFHTLCTKLGIKGSEWNLVLKYFGALHKYIQTKIEFLDISSLGFTYQYAVKIDQNKQEFGSANPQQPKYGKCIPNSQNIQPQYN
jgi:hypothetical protein